MSAEEWVGARRIGRLHVVKLSGSDYECGYQHGRFLRDAIERGPLVFLRGLFPSIARVALSGPSWLSRRLGTGLLRGLAWRMERRFPAWYREGLEGLAVGADLDPAEVLRLSVIPDLIQVLAGYAFRGRRRAAMALATRQVTCSAVLAGPPATADGHVVHARNLDYDGVGCWDAEPAVFFVRPDEGLRRVYVAAAGVHTGGITGMNEAGLFFNTHSAFTRWVGLSGWPVQAIGDAVLRRAESVPEAVEIIRGAPRAAGWLLVLSDRQGRLAVVECDSRHVDVLHGRKGVLAVSNAYRTPKLRAGEISLGEGLSLNIQGRARRLERLLARARGQIDVSALIAMLRDRWDPFEAREREIGNIVAGVLTIQTIAANLTTGQLWVSCDLAPASLGAFIGFDLTAEWDRPAPPSPEIIAGLQGGKEPPGEAARRIANAHRRLSMEEDAAGALEELRAAERLQPGDPAIRLMIAAMLLRTGEPGSVPEVCDGAVLEARTAHHRHLGLLMRGWAYDLLGWMDAARGEYARLLAQSGVAPYLRAAAGRGLRRRFSRRRARSIVPLIPLGDLAH